MSPIEKIIWWTLIALMFFHGIQIAEAGTSFQGLTAKIDVVNLDEKKRADDAINEAKKASSAINEYIKKLISLRSAVNEERAFRREIIFFLSLNKYEGKVLTDFDVLTLTNMANAGKFQQAVKFMDSIIEIHEQKSSSPLGASVYCRSEIIQ